MIQQKKPDPFCDSVLGVFQPDKGNTDKNVYAWYRAAEINITEEYAQDWIDPLTFEKKLVFGKIKLRETKTANRKTGEIGFTRTLDPALKGGKIKDKIA